MALPDPSTVTMGLPRRDARDKLLGRTRYTVDRALPRMLHAAILRAEVASARILRIDTTQARRMPGVRAIASAEDAPGMHGIGIADHPLFASGVIRFHGEQIAAVAADTYEQAQAAARAIEVELEPLPPVLTMAEALTPGAPLIHPDWKCYEVLFEGGARGGNVAWEASVVRGDTDAAFAREDIVVVESCFRVGRQNHVSLEPRAVIASYEDGRYHIETSTQVPWTVRNQTSKLLGVPPSRVHVTVPPVGGGFGQKFDCTLEPYAAILARKSGQPVRLVYSRQEEMLTCLCRENAEIKIRSAVTRDGEIAGREAVAMTAHTLGGNYKVGSIKLASRAVYTNTAPNGAFRACNGVYNTFALERHTDEVCQAIGMDPLEFRRLNVLRNGDLGATGQVFEGDVLGPMLDRMAQMRDASPSKKHLAGGRLYGRATVVGTWFIFVGPSTATINLNADGSATLITAGVELGQGTMVQALPQIVAYELGIHPDNVIVRPADTDAAGFDLGVGGGRTTVSLGAASRAAAADVRDQILKAAGALLQTVPDKLVLRSGRVEIEGKEGSGMTIAQVVQHLHRTTGPVVGSGSFTNPGVPSIPGCAAGHFIDAIDIPVFNVHDCEVAVDPDTGHVDILSYKVVQDVGRALNPRAILGQIQGGVTQGIGYALHEEHTIGEDGCIRQNSLETYRVPLAQDTLPVEIELYEGAPSIGPLGVKGAGEVPIMNPPAAIACAVANATGCRVQQTPLTPPRVLGLMLGREPELELPHISANWWENVFRRPN
ncbi:Aldehyde oxidase and xanthine dehydrogenase molybdopterin binding protein [Mesorhizobium plurifarium]|uniref:Aldehyde oxidase and xanthine dehydrogenase molybdopterin binding protein n=1 Tax=Mesorhizobium plurifarium TaxID=69974 RepID=A0A090ESG2_MESPL|nr:Aldehyde oxidase and xanthine dehydrogenase molybdopterin binding protein [Mesorhizobium plurifarium]